MEEPKDRLMQAIREAGFAGPTEAWEAKRKLLMGKDLFISNTNGNRAISRRAAEMYAHAFDIKGGGGWLLYGTREPEPDLPQARPPREVAAIVVPHLSWVSAGAMMSDASAQEAIGQVRMAGLPKGDWFALTVRGDSMDRISPPDSVIFVNRRDKRLVANACYVIDDGEGNATYKRYRPNPMRFEPVSTNPSHEPIFPDNEPTIVGRVGLSMIKM